LKSIKLLFGEFSYVKVYFTDLVIECLFDCCLFWTSRYFL